ncbi:MAG: DNA mismatch repair protein MutS [Deltaproteobacteria bacterium]|nr:MAG: DNA mismatch repair protein MutS [Deltaproteobacteria bacterium]
MPGAKNSADTPVMRQYLAAKAAHPDAVVLFRMGDFYETFFEDAVRIAPVLGITLTTRDRTAPDPVPMAGVPHHSIGGYLKTLVERGFKVAICEQMETPEEARRRKGPNLVRREVVRVVTPGVRIDEDHLRDDAPNFLVALSRGEDGYGLAALDVSTADFVVAATQDADLVRAKLVQLDPPEILTPKSLVPLVEAAFAGREPPAIRTDSPAPSPEEVARIEHLAAESGLDDLASEEATAAASALAYAARTQPGRQLLLHRLRRSHFGRTLVLDETSLRNLEVLQNLRDGGRAGTLLSAVDATRTPGGARLLRTYLAEPPLDPAEIAARHEAVEALVAEPGVRKAVRSLLRDVRDLSRIAARARLDAVTPPQLAALRDSLRAVPRLAETLGELAERRTDGCIPCHLDLGDDLLADLADRLDRMLVDAPPSSAKDGGVIRSGADPELDRQRKLRDGSRRALSEIETRERERTQIPSLKVQHNRVFGYYIEVPKAHLSKVPSHYVRKQTLASVERYVTEELAEHEAAVLGAQARALERERALIAELVGKVAAAGTRLCRLADRIARVDVLAGFAEVADAHGYVRPEIVDDPVLEIEEGRHPVVERLVERGTFVPNDVHLRAGGVAGPDGRGARLWIVTGPNMGGKSTVMRQTAHIVLLAHAGSFVPARSAVIGRTDRIFTRVGASDDLARGESTFMVEMRETAQILAGAGPRSLVLLDELGRGTATYDGLALAWAVAEHLHDQIGCRSMFATHYHELCDLAGRLPGVANVHVTVHEAGGRIVFLHRLAPGPAERSYGIAVGRLAGLPRRVLARAARLLERLEAGAATGPQLDLFAATPVPTGERGPSSGEALRLVEELAALDVDDLSPREAFAALCDLVDRAREVAGDGPTAGGGGRP